MFGSQIGVVPPQCAEVKHCAHAPLGRQWSRPKALAAHWLSIEHPTHAPDAEQIGVVPEQSALVTHCLHWPAALQKPPEQVACSMRCV